MFDNITINVCKSMVTYLLCVHAAVPAAYSMLLCNESVSVINAGCIIRISTIQATILFTVVAIIFTAFKSILFSLFHRVD